MKDLKKMQEVTHIDMAYDIERRMEETVNDGVRPEGSLSCTR